MPSPITTDTPNNRKGLGAGACDVRNHLRYLECCYAHSSRDQHLLAICSTFQMQLLVRPVISHASVITRSSSMFTVLYSSAQGIACP